MEDHKLGEDELRNQDELIRKAGLEPTDWVLTGYRQWGSEDHLQEYIAVVPNKPEGLAVPARMPGDYKRKLRPVQEFKTKPRLAAFISDQHAPYHDKGLHQVTCEWLAENQPHQVIIGGDLLEFDTISRHRSFPKPQAVQTAIDSGYGILRDYVQASPRSAFQMLPGNHDVRLQHLIVDQARELYGIRPGSVEEEEIPGALSLQTLLRLDELGIEYIEGTYENAQVALSPHLAARHGWLAYKGAGRSAMRHLEILGHSIIHGHTHRQAITHRTVYDVAGTPSVQVGIEAGAMCQLSLAESYATAADWQQGFVAVTLFPDGTFHPELATYVKDKLFFRDQVFAA